MVVVDPEGGVYGTTVNAIIPAWHPTKPVEIAKSVLWTGGSTEKGRGLYTGARLVGMANLKAREHAMDELGIHNVELRR